MEGGALTYILQIPLVGYRGIFLCYATGISLMKIRSICFLFSLVALVPLLTSCVDSKLEAGLNESSLVTAFFDDDGAAVQVINARDNNKWVYFDLETFSVVIPQDPQTDTQWDVAFQRFKVKTNSGVSGAGGVQVATFRDAELLTVNTAPLDGYYTDRNLSELSDDELLQLGDNIFFSVCAAGHDDEKADNYCLANEQVDRDHLNPAEAAYVFLTQGGGHVMKEGSDKDNRIDDDPILGWYDYFLHENHLLRPTPDTWVIRSTEGVEFSLQMLGYYGYQEGDAESGTIAFRYFSITPDFEIPPPGEQQLSVSFESLITSDNSDQESLSGNVPMVVQYTAVATGAEGDVNWQWDFGDGSNSTEKNPEHTYSNTGIYNVKLTITDSRGVDTSVESSETLTVVEPGALMPKANAGVDQEIQLSNGATDIEVTLDATLTDDPDGNNENIIYTWSGATVDPVDVVDPQVTLAAGSYTFLLTVTDEYGNVADDEVVITVKPAGNNNPPVAVVSANTIKGPAPLEISFTGSESTDSDGPIDSYAWDFNDSNQSSDADPVHTFVAPGTYFVSLTVTDSDGVTGEAVIRVVAEASGEIFTAVQDTYLYELLGNQGTGIDDNDTPLDTSDDFERDGDSHGLAVWNHESSHGAKGLIEFDALAITEATNLGVGNYKATLHLFQRCEISGFIAACPGYDGASVVNTDIILQATGWLENDTAIAWSSISESSAPFVTLTQTRDITQTGNIGWISVDVTTLVEAWVGGTPQFGFALSQEAYPVIRATNGSIAVSAFCDSESSGGFCATGNFKPYLEIEVAP